MEAKERIYSAVDGRLVREGDPDGAFLKYAIGDPIDSAHNTEVNKLTAKTGVTSQVFHDDEARGVARVMVAEPTIENRAVAGAMLADDPKAPILMHDRLATELADEARERANTDQDLEESSTVTKVRLYWTDDKRRELVAEGDARAAFLAYGVADRIRRGDLDAYEALSDDDDADDATPAAAKATPAKKTAPAPVK